MPKKILLADDSITIQKVVELTFSDGDYEVTAVNNGAKAIQKLSEMRPDIILSDIIMPEKNGYEVCEFVKSHPDYRSIPVVLLTGTFEPFDPDRADKAGCDAVVTKPFESQSLIHKVEELIDAARASSPGQPSAAAAAPVAAPAPSPSASPWEDEAPAADIFGAPPAATGATSEMPFASAGEPPAGETRAFPKLNFADFDSPATTQSFTPPLSPPPTAPPAAPPSPAAADTPTFPTAAFGDTGHSGASPAPAEAPAVSEDSPFGAPPPAESFSGETRAFPRMSFDDLRKMAEAAPPVAQPAEESPWGSQGSGGETRAFPQMNFEQLSRAASEAPGAAESSSSWGTSEDAGPAWGSTAEPPPATTPITPFDAPAAAFEQNESPAFEPAAATTFDEPASAAFDAPAEPADTPAWSAPPAPVPSGGNGLELSDEQIDRIARRVVQLMSDQVVRNIAWEVIPDMAEMVVKERIRQLENE